MQPKRSTPPVLKWRDMSDIIQPAPLLKLPIEKPKTAAPSPGAPLPSPGSSTITSSVFTEDDDEYDPDYDPLADSDEESVGDYPDDEVPDDEVTGRPLRSRKLDLFDNIRLMAPLLHSVLSSDSSKPATSQESSGSARGTAVPKAKSVWVDPSTIVWDTTL